MFRKMLSCVAVAVFLVLPTSLNAGGPPWLCLPVDGVTADNAKVCSELLAGKLEHKVWSRSSEIKPIQIRQHANQWYLTFYMKEDVELHELESALKGSGFSIPRDKLRLFGTAILVLDEGKVPPTALLADLEALPYVSVADSKTNGNSLSVTVDMPYPRGETRPEAASLTLDTFQRNDLSSDQSTKSESPATSQALPSYGAFRDVAAKHNASLKGIRWSTEFACRMQGCVAAPTSTPPQLSSAK